MEEEMKRIHHRHHRDLEAKAQENLFIRQELEGFFFFFPKIMNRNYFNKKKKKTS